MSSPLDVRATSSRSERHTYKILLWSTQIQNHDDAWHHTHYVPVIKYLQWKVQITDHSPYAPFPESTTQIMSFVPSVFSRLAIISHHKWMSARNNEMVVGWTNYIAEFSNAYIQNHLLKGTNIESQWCMTPHTLSAGHQMLALKGAKYRSLSLCFIPRVHK